MVNRIHRTEPAETADVIPRLGIVIPGLPEISFVAGERKLRAGTRSVPLIAVGEEAAVPGFASINITQDADLQVIGMVELQSPPFNLGQPGAEINIFS